MKPSPATSVSPRPIKRRRRSSPPRGVTISDVARAAGVSTATVSRVLAESDRVSEELKESVRSAVDRLNYRPNRVARRLRTPGRQLWALVVSDIENPFFTSIARGVEEAAHESGAVVLLCNSDLDPAREARYFEIAVTESVGAVVLAPCSSSVDISLLQEAQVPVVVINQALDAGSVVSITSDNYTGGRLAAEEFLDHGYPRIAAIVGRTTAQGWSDRLRGLSDTMSERSGHVVHVKHMDNRVAGGRQAMEELLEHWGTFDAVFVSNNQMTVGALRALQAAGLSVPGDIGLIGCDLSSTPMTYPVEITSVNQDPRKMGFLAGIHIMSQRDPTDAREAIRLTPQLFRGDSLLGLGQPG